MTDPKPAPVPDDHFADDDSNDPRDLDSGLRMCASPGCAEYVDIEDSSLYCFDCVKARRERTTT